MTSSSPTGQKPWQEIDILYILRTHRHQLALAPICMYVYIYGEYWRQASRKICVVELVSLKGVKFFFLLFLLIVLIRVEFLQYVRGE